jgi:hypothetical protein
VLLKEGTVLAEGGKDMLTDEVLSELFSCPVSLKI